MDYRFAIRCWQDQAGDENAKANVFVDGVQVLTEVEITAASEDSPQLITWESTGLTAPADDTSFDIKFVLVNEHYVDASTDRNININGFGYLTKAADTSYKLSTFDTSDPDNIIKLAETTITDFTEFNNYAQSIKPIAVVGDNIADDWWSSRESDSFYTVTVYGGDNGTTLTVPTRRKTCSA